MSKLEEVVRRIKSNYINSFSKEDKILFGSILLSYENSKNLNSKKSI